MRNHHLEGLRGGGGAGGVKIDELVSKLVALEGGNLHLMVDAKPTVRVHHGLLQPLEGYEVLRPADTEQILKEVIPKKLLEEEFEEEFEEEGEASFTYEVYRVGRFRVNGVNALRQAPDIMPLCAC